METIFNKKEENAKSFEAYLNDSTKYEILLKKEIEGKRLLFQLIILEDSNKKIYCSL